MNEIFSIGSDRWPGISKLAEESGEVLQVIGKLMGTGGEINHWDGSDLKVRLEEEIADVLAACQFVLQNNNLNGWAITCRMNEKMALFDSWHRSGTNTVGK